MLWACKRPRNRRSSPKTGEERREAKPGQTPADYRLPTGSLGSPTQDGTECVNGLLVTEAYSYITFGTHAGLPPPYGRKGASAGLADAPAPASFQIGA